MIQPGTVLGNIYEVKEQIGAGGGGTIFKAFHKNLLKDVAIKKIHDSGTYDMNSVRREADILKNLHHSYLPQVFDFLIIESGVYTVMDYIPGKSIKDYIDSGYRFTEKEIVKYGTQLCEALAYLHSQKPAIIHGDIKPANIMLTPQGNICLIDFNISGFTSDSGTAMVYGYSEGYAAPEQLVEYQKIVAQMRASGARVASPVVSSMPGATAAMSGATAAMPGATAVMTGATAAMPGATAIMPGATAAMPAAPGQAGGTAILNYDQAGQQMQAAPGQAGGTAILNYEQAGQQMQTTPGQAGGTAILNYGQPAQQMQATPGQAGGTAILNYGQPAQQMQTTPGQAGGTAILDFGQMQQAAPGQMLSTAQMPGAQQAAQMPNVVQSEEELPGIMVDARSDVYSVAATLYHMLTGMMITQVGGQVITTNASNGLVVILNKAMDTDPSKRYQDAVRMLEAFRNIYKLDKRYKRITARQQALQIVFIVMMAGGVLLALFGLRNMRQGKSDLYDSYIGELQKAEDDNDEKHFNEYYELATQLFPNNIEAYYEQAQFYYKLMQYETAVDYINEYIIDNYDISDADKNSDVYYLLGLSYFELEDYVSAANAYKNALRDNTIGGDLYVQYAITLARLGQTDEAEETLEIAKSRNVADYMVSLTQGEIQKILGNYDDAIANFSDCVNQSTDDYVTMRAYVMLASTYSDKGASLATNSENISDAIALYRKGGEILSDASNRVAQEYRVTVLQRQAQCYINAVNLSSDPEDAHKAVDALKTVISSGYSDYTLYNNIVIIYQNVGELAEADAVLDEMESRYSSFYSYYMRRAFQEVLKQNVILENPGSGIIDYTDFMTYYNKAKELYTSAGVSDVEMQQLEALKNDLAAAGLISE